MMKLDLKALEYLILERPNTIDALGDEARLEIYCSEISVMEQNLIKALNCLVYGRQRELMVKRQMKKFQTGVMALLNIIALSAVPTEFESFGQALLFRLLDYQGKHYTQYFDFFVAAPPCYVLQNFNLLNTSRLPLLAALKQKGISPGLQEILVNCYSMHNFERDITFHKLGYLERLQTSIIGFCKSVGNAPFEPMLIDYLIYRNLNAPSFIAYVKGIIQQKLNEIFDPAAQYELWCRQEKWLCSMIVKDDVGFGTKQVTAKNQLMDYVTAHLVYYHKQQCMLQTHQFAQKQPPAIDYRVKVNLSADALAYLFRLFIEVGLVEANPRTKLFAFMAQYFQTAGIGEGRLSANSLEVKYKQVVQRTAIQVHLALKKMNKIITASYEI